MLNNSNQEKSMRNQNDNNSGSKNHQEPSKTNKQNLPGANDQNRDRNARMDNDSGLRDQARDQPGSGNYSQGSGFRSTKEEDESQRRSVNRSPNEKKDR